MSSEVQIPSFIRRRMPNASEAELIEAIETFKRYIEVAIRIYERKSRETNVPICAEVGGAIQ